MPSSLAGGFFEGWSTPLTPSEHLLLLRRATHVVLAMEGSTVVGFGNALSDGILSAYIPLLEVVPSRRGQGIGSELIRHLLVDLGSCTRSMSCAMRTSSRSTSDLASRQPAEWSVALTACGRRDLTLRLEPINRPNTGRQLGA